MLTVVLTTAKQVISRRGKNEDGCQTYNQSATVVTRGYRKFTLCTCQCVPS